MVCGGVVVWCLGLEEGVEARVHHAADRQGRRVSAAGRRLSHTSHAAHATRAARPAQNARPHHHIRAEET